MDNQESNACCKSICNCGNLKCVFAVVLMLFLAALTASVSVGIFNKLKESKYIGRDIEVQDTITVSDSSEVYAKPDLALTTLSVITEAKTVGEAMSENSQKMNAVIAFIKGQGVEDKDLKTTNFNISSRYEWYQETTCFYPPCPSGERVLVGYEVTQSLQVKIRDMAKIGDILEGATEKGANQAGDLYFTIDKEEELKAQARKEAIEKTKAKAKELAGQLGVKLVRITNFSEGGVWPVYTPYALEKAAAGIGGGEAPQIETGENKIEVTVSITYEIN